MGINVHNEMVSNNYLLYVPNAEDESEPPPNGWPDSVGVSQMTGIFEATPNTCDVPTNRGASATDRSTWSNARDTEGMSICSNGRDATTEEVLHLITVAASVVYPTLWAPTWGSEAGRALQLANGDCGWGYTGDWVDPSSSECSGQYAYDDETCGEGCLVVEGIYWASVSFIGGLYTKARASDIQREWLMATPDTSMETEPENVINARSLQSGSPDLYALVSDTTSNGHAWLPNIMPDGRYQGFGNGPPPNPPTNKPTTSSPPTGECVVIGDWCIPGPPHNDPQGAVCANDGQPNEAYCNYLFGPNACVIGCRSFEIPDETEVPTKGPTKNPTPSPTEAPTKRPTVPPTGAPMTKPTDSPTKHPTRNPTPVPTKSPTVKPTVAPTKKPSKDPTSPPTGPPTAKPTPAKAAVSVISEVTFNNIEIPEDPGEFVLALESCIAQAVLPVQTRTVTITTTVKVTHINGNPVGRKRFFSRLLQASATTTVVTFEITQEVEVVSGDIVTIGEQLKQDMGAALNVEGVSEAIQTEELQQFGDFSLGKIETDLGDGSGPISETASPTISRAPTKEPTTDCSEVSSVEAAKAGKMNPTKTTKGCKSNTKTAKGSKTKGRKATNPFE